MALFRVGFLVFVWAISSGYRFRCYAFCTDQTGIQHDYIEQRDRCRGYAELKIDMSLRSVRGPVDGKTNKSQLVNLFNECMANNGWNIVSENKAAASGTTTALQAAPAAAGAATVQNDVVEIYEQKQALSRSADCMFARHAAANSSISATRAKACDLECAQRLAASPDAPRPSACPTDVNPDPDLIRGGERVE